MPRNDSNLVLIGTTPLRVRQWDPPQKIYVGWTPRRGRGPSRATFRPPRAVVGAPWATEHVNGMVVRARGTRRRTGRAAVHKRAPHTQKADHPPG